MPETTDAPAVSAIQQIPVDQIKPSRHQARKDFDEESIKQLAVSIDKEDLLQPITVRKVEEGYEIIAGERRLRAVKSLSRPTIAAIVIEVVNEAAACAKGLVENLQREDLNPIDEAQGFQDLLNLKDSHWNQERISEAVGKSPTYISESLSLLKLPESLIEKFCRQNFSRSLGVELARLPGQDVQLKAAEAIEGLNRNQAREVLKALKGESSPDKKESKSAAAQPPAPFKFTKKGSGVAIAAFYPGTGSSDDFFAELRTVYMAWTAQ